MRVCHSTDVWSSRRFLRDYRSAVAEGTRYARGMKRHPALIPLSHDHQHALAQALRLQRSADADAATQWSTLQEFVAFTEASIASHFDEEELVLQRAIDATGIEDLRAAQAGMLADHTWLRARFAQLAALVAAGDRSAVDPELLRATGERLTTHVRFEERVLFELLQTSFPDEQTLTKLVGDDVQPRD